MSHSPFYRQHTATAWVNAYQTGHCCECFHDPLCDHCQRCDSSCAPKHIHYAYWLCKFHLIIRLAENPSECLFERERANVQSTT